MTAALVALAGGRSLANGRILHGGFFLGPRDFYMKLHNLSPELRQQICMTGVQRTNQLLLHVGDDFKWSQASLNLLYYGSTYPMANAY